MRYVDIIGEQLILYIVRKLKVGKLVIGNEQEWLSEEILTELKEQTLLEILSIDDWKERFGRRD